jgi:hypothetical protein
MLIEFDQTTMANMTAALDAVCKRIPPEKDSHEVRKRIADAMVACAKSGRRTLVDFVAPRAVADPDVAARSRNTKYPNRAAIAPLLKF